MLVCFHRMLLHLCGFQIDSSDIMTHPYHRRRFLPKPYPRMPSTQDEELAEDMTNLHLHSPRQAQVTLASKLPSWGQIKHLTSQAQNLVVSQGASASPEKVFLAMLSQVSLISDNQSYWAYFPDPPLLRVTDWGKLNIKVFTDNPELLGGISDSLIPHKMSYKINFKGLIEETPICFATDNKFIPQGCMPINYRQYFTDCPPGFPDMDNKKRSLWLLEMVSLGYYIVNETYVNKTLPEAIDPCGLKNNKNDFYWNNMIDPREEFPYWFQCGFMQRAQVFQPKFSDVKIYDWSASAPHFDYKN
ncbi:endogenous retrovirus group K member 21 Env polyprotein-like [Marmota monax]|uniref:endogenous retrovirus group K member 21 Env polyprotein-like n=1 Tax=Marmota monax TaxID=9995 RepID=UPI001EAFED2C|nr:endogenous retrovirus group K member 21 Env polyprotein-like [Marmota monax]